MHRALILPVLLATVAACVARPSVSRAGDPATTVRELERFRTAEAHQAVAVDAAHVYAVDSAAIGQYDKTTKKRMRAWTAPVGSPITHLNSAVVVGKRLHCAHSNYPEIPPASSIETFDTETLAPAESHSFGITPGWATWADRHGGAWWVAFAYYDRDASAHVAGRDARWSSVVRYDDDWRETGAWTFPAAVVSRFDGFSNSGGSWATDDILYATGHHRPELWVLRLPAAGASLVLAHVVRMPAHGQGIAWDRSRTDVLYAIDRETREVLVLEVTTQSQK